MELLAQLATAVLPAVFAAGGAWMAVRVELKYLRRDVDELREFVGLGKRKLTA